jgi:hypothetical protein
MKKQHIILNGTLRTLKPGVDADQSIAKLREKGYTVEKVQTPPSVKTMTKWSMDGVAKATDGCRVEPDGTCSHGCKSWLLVYGVI